MNKPTSTGLLLAILHLVCIDLLAQKEIYTHPDFESFAGKHELIAIIPFEATIKLRPKDMDKMSETEFQKLQLQEGLAVQSALHTYYLKRKSQGKLRMNLDVQTPHTTNVLLSKANINQDNYREYSIQEIAGLLGVNGIVHGELNSSSPMSDGASVALGLAVGFYGATNTGDISIQLTDAETGTLLWKYDKTLSRSLGSDTQTVINTMMKKASKKFPYEATGVPNL